MRDRIWSFLRAVHDRLHEESEAAETQAIGFVLQQDPDEPEDEDAPDDAPESFRRGVRRPGSIGTAGRGSKRKGGPARGL